MYGVSVADSSIPSLPQVLYLPTGSNYLVYKPFKHGRLNVTQPPPGSTQDPQTPGPPHFTGDHSLSFVMNMLEDLWTKAIEEYLEIERKDFKVGTVEPHYSGQFSSHNTV